MKKIITTFILTLLVCMAAVAKDQTATAVFTVSPKMHCENCENKIKNNLRHEKGVKKIETSIADQTVTVTYLPSKTTPEKIAHALAKIGYDATTPCNGGQCGKEKVCTDKKQECSTTTCSEPCGSDDKCTPGKNCDRKTNCCKK